MRRAILWLYLWQTVFKKTVFFFSWPATTAMHRSRALHTKRSFCEWKPVINLANLWSSFGCPYFRTTGLYFEDNFKMFWSAWSMISKRSDGRWAGTQGETSHLALWEADIFALKSVPRPSLTDVFFWVPDQESLRHAKRVRNVVYFRIASRFAIPF